MITASNCKLALAVWMTNSWSIGSYKFILQWLTVTVNTFNNFGILKRSLKSYKKVFQKKSSPKKMKLGVLKLISFGLWFLLLLISVFSSTTESSRVIFQRSTSTAPNTLKGNIVSVPMVRCREGYHLDHRKKCRKIVSSWFRWSKYNWVCVRVNNQMRK